MVIFELCEFVFHFRRLNLVVTVCICDKLLIVIDILHSQGSQGHISIFFHYLFQGRTRSTIVCLYN